MDKGRIIPNKEELIFDKEREISFQKKEEILSKPPSINQEDLQDERYEIRTM